jgi:hypothetical protein
MWKLHYMKEALPYPSHPDPGFSLIAGRWGLDEILCSSFAELGKEGMEWPWFKTTVSPLLPHFIHFLQQMYLCMLSMIRLLPGVCF